jgi:hypothetical protein
MHSKYKKIMANPLLEVAGGFVLEEQECGICGYRQSPWRLGVWEQSDRSYMSQAL